MSEAYNNLNNNQRRTLEAIQANSRHITWEKARTLLNGLGVLVKDREGSRVRASFQGAVLCLHKPHGKTEKTLTYRNMCSLQKFLGHLRVS